MFAINEKIHKHFYISIKTNEPFLEECCNQSQHYFGLVIRKPDFCICENKDADQLRGIDSAIPLLSKSENSSL